MPEGEIEYYVPRRLDDPAKLLWWDLDEFIAGMTGLLVGVWSGSFTVALVLAVAGVKGLSRLKAGGGRGHVRRMLYWHFGMTSAFGLIRTPPSYIREFVG